MKKTKNYGIIIMLAILCFIIYLFVNYNNNKDWTIKFKSELDSFLGEGNWECISKEKRTSIIYKETYHNHKTGQTTTKPGTFTDWHIKFLNKDGNEEIWRITNHSLKINNNKHSFLSSKRLSSKQALVLELSDIYCGLASDKILNDIIKIELPENIADCLRISISHNGGNPKPKFYDELFKQPWFNINNVDAKNFLALDSHEFYIDILAFNYKTEKLTEQEQQTLFNSMKSIEKRLLQEYRNNASFQIYFDKEHQVEYIDGYKK